MRISTQGKFNLIRQAVSQAASRYVEQQSKIASMKKILKPSDDPVNLARVLKSYSKLNRIENLKGIRGQVKVYLSQIESSMDTSIDIVTRLKEIAVSQAGSTANEQTRSIAANEVRELKEQLVSLANTQINGVYLFGGTQTGSPPYSTNGTYNGTTDVVRVQVDDRLQIKASVAGSDFFSTGSESAFTAIDDFISGLENNSINDVQAALDNINNIIDNMTQKLASLGAGQSWLENLNSMDEDRKMVQTEQLSELVEVDIVEETVFLKQYENAYQAALAASSKIMNLNLTNFL